MMGMMSMTFTCLRKEDSQRRVIASPASATVRGLFILGHLARKRFFAILKI